jgi:protein phosphatase
MGNRVRSVVIPYADPIVFRSRFTILDGTGGCVLRRFDPERIETAMLSDVGLIRASNQDACGEFADGSGARALVLCDGMGGRRGGEVASRLAVETIGRVFGSSDAELAVRLEDAFAEANARIAEQAEADPRLVGMGTTAVAVALDGGATAWVAHVGDSRLYRLRAGTFEAITADHSVVAEFQRRGVLSAEQAATHPRRNELLRSIGGDGVQIEVTRIDVQPDDRYLLCSDGLWSLVPDSEIAAVLQNDTAAAAVARLVEMAKENGGTDNVTVQVAEIPPFVSEATPASPADPPAVPRGRFRRWIESIRRRWSRS